jgi:hypothetical protein
MPLLLLQHSRQERGKQGRNHNGERKQAKAAPILLHPALLRAPRHAPGEVVLEVIRVVSARELLPGIISATNNSASTTTSSTSSIITSIALALSVSVAG